MTLRLQLINFFKSHKGGILGVQLQREMFETDNGGFFSPGYIDRTARLLTEEGRLERSYDEKGLAIFTYKPSVHEKFHQSFALQK